MNTEVDPSEGCPYHTFGERLKEKYAEHEGVRDVGRKQSPIPARSGGDHGHISMDNISIVVMTFG